ncbi:unnamed protein product [Rotaria sp. Silwood1]|nr:unnamed protein product [Rotaria sp. Silwood1]
MLCLNLIDKHKVQNIHIATATMDIDINKQHDQITIFERPKQINKELKQKADNNNNIYYDINNYQQVYEKNAAQENASSDLV